MKVRLSWQIIIRASLAQTISGVGLVTVAAHTAQPPGVTEQHMGGKQ